jgi:hypothetical protein
MAKMCEPGSEAGARCDRQRRTPGAAVQIEAQIRMESRHCACRREKQIIEIAVALENRCEARLDNDSDPRVRHRTAQDRQSRCGEDTIAQRSQTEN